MIRPEKFWFHTNIPIAGVPATSNISFQRPVWLYDFYCVGSGAGFLVVYFDFIPTTPYLTNPGNVPKDWTLGGALSPGASYDKSIRFTAPTMWKQVDLGGYFVKDMYFENTAANAQSIGFAYTYDDPYK